jgi:hypothetical protein
MDRSHVSDPAGQRKQRRIEVGLMMHIRGKEANGKPFEDTSHTANVSRTGALFTTIRDIQLGDEVEIIIPPRVGRGSEGDFISRARIVRLTPGDNPGEKVVGVQFLDSRFFRVYVSEDTSG